MLLGPEWGSREQELQEVRLLQGSLPCWMDMLPPAVRRLWSLPLTRKVLI